MTPETQRQPRDWAMRRAGGGHASRRVMIPPGGYGLTLLELLVVLALLVMLVGLVAPSAITVLDLRQFDEKREQVGAYMTLIRAKAQLRGEPIEVVYEPPISADGGGLFDFGSAPEGFGGLTPSDIEAMGGGESGDRPGRLIARPFRPGAGDDSDREGLEDGSDEGVRVSRLPRLPMGGAFRMSTELPEGWSDEMADRFGPGAGMGEVPEELLAGPDMADLFAGEEDEPITLVVFFPDGSAVTPRQSVYLIHDDDQVARLVVNRWTGVARLEIERPPDGDVFEDEMMEDEAYEGGEVWDGAEPYELMEGTEGLESGPEVGR